MSKHKIPQYAKNVGRSTKKAAFNVIRTQMPTMSDTTVTMTNTVTEFRRIATTGKQSLTMADRLQTRLFRPVQEIMSNIKEDLKSGNLYNEDREMGALSGMDGLMNSMFDDEEFTTEEQADTGFNSGAFNKVLQSSTASSLAASERSSNFIARSATANTEYLGQLQSKLNTQHMMIITKHHMEMMKGLNNLQNIGMSIVEFNNQTMTDYFDKDLQTQNAQLSELQEIRSLLNEQAEILKATKVNKKAGKGLKENILGEIFNPNGSINTSAFMQNAKNNIGNMIPVSKDIINMGLEGIKANPIGTLMQLVMSSAIPKNGKKKMGKLDNGIGGVFANAMFTLNNWRDNPTDKQWKKTLGMIFGTDKTSMNANLGLYKNQALDADLELKKSKAITEVIPSYLSEILKSMTGTDKSFDYNKGMFVNNAEIRQKYLDDRRMSSQSIAYRSADKAKMKATAFTNGMGARDRDAFARDLGIFHEWYMMTELYKKKKVTYAEALKNGLSNLGGGPQAFNIIWQMYKSMPASDINKDRRDFQAGMYSNTHYQILELSSSGGTAAMNGLSDDYNGNLTKPGAKNKNAKVNTASYNIGKYSNSEIDSRLKRQFDEDQKLRTQREEEEERAKKESQFQTPKFVKNAKDRINKFIKNNYSGTDNKVFKQISDYANKIFDKATEKVEDMNDPEYFENLVDNIQDNVSVKFSKWKGMTKDQKKKFVSSKVSGLKMSANNVKGQVSKTAKNVKAKAKTQVDVVAETIGISNDTEDDADSSESKKYNEALTNYAKTHLPKAALSGAIGGVIGKLLHKSPLLGSVIGTGASILYQSSRVQTFLFGDPENKDDKGLLGGLKEKFDTAIFEPLQKVMEPFTKAITEKFIDPMKNWLNDKADGVANWMANKLGVKLNPKEDKEQKRHEETINELHNISEAVKDKNKEANDEAKKVSETINDAINPEAAGKSGKFSQVFDKALSGIKDGGTLGISAGKGALISSVLGMGPIPGAIFGSIFGKRKINKKNTQQDTKNAKAVDKQMKKAEDAEKKTVTATYNKVGMIKASAMSSLLGLGPIPGAIFASMINKSRKKNAEAKAKKDNEDAEVIVKAEKDENKPKFKDRIGSEAKWAAASSLLGLGPVPGFLLGRVMAKHKKPKAKLTKEEKEQEKMRKALEYEQNGGAKGRIKRFFGKRKNEALGAAASSLLGLGPIPGILMARVYNKHKYKLKTVDTEEEKNTQEIVEESSTPQTTEEKINDIAKKTAERNKKAQESKDKAHAAKMAKDEQALGKELTKKAIEGDRADIQDVVKNKMNSADTDEELKATERQTNIAANLMGAGAVGAAVASEKQKGPIASLLEILGGLLGGGKGIIGTLVGTALPILLGQGLSKFSDWLKDNGFGGHDTVNYAGDANFGNFTDSIKTGGHVATDIGLKFAAGKFGLTKALGGVKTGKITTPGMVNSVLGMKTSLEAANYHDAEAQAYDDRYATTLAQEEKQTAFKHKAKAAAYGIDAARSFNNSNLGKKFKNAIISVFKNEKVVNIVKKCKLDKAFDAAKKWLTTSADNIVTKITGKASEGALKKLTAKLASFASVVAAWLPIATAVMAFINGWNNAPRDLGVDETTTGFWKARLSNAVVYVVDDLLCGLPSMFGLSDWLTQQLTNILMTKDEEKELKVSQESETAEYEQFLKDNDLNRDGFTQDMYDKMKHKSIWGHVKGIFGVNDLDKYKSGGKKNDELKKKYGGYIEASKGQNDLLNGINTLANNYADQMTQGMQNYTDNTQTITDQSQTINIITNSLQTGSGGRGLSVQSVLSEVTKTLANKHVSNAKIYDLRHGRKVLDNIQGHSPLAKERPDYIDSIYRKMGMLSDAGSGGRGINTSKLLKSVKDDLSHKMYNGQNTIETIDNDETAVINNNGDIRHKAKDGTISKIKSGVAKVGGWINSGVKSGWNAVKSGVAKVGGWINSGVKSLYNKAANSWLGKKIGSLFGSGARGNDPDYYNQADPRWGNDSFGMYDGHRDTVADGGCGPTVAAMALQKLTGQTITPDNMAKLAMSSGTKYDDGGTDPSFFSIAGQKYGYDFDQSYGVDKNTISNLKSGKPVVFMGKDQTGTSPFGTGTHYVLGTGMDAKGNVNILDPQNQSNNRKFNIRDIANSTTNVLNPRGRGKYFGRGRFGGRGSTFGLIQPTKYGTVQGTGYGDKEGHKGVDIHTKRGTPVYAVADGTIQVAQYGGVKQKGASDTAFTVQLKLNKPIEYNGNTFTRIFYTHLQCNLCVKTGDTVTQGQVLGYTGIARKCAHLHFSVMTSKGEGGHSNTMNVFGLSYNEKLPTVGTAVERPTTETGTKEIKLTDPGDGNAIRTSTTTSVSTSNTQSGSNKVSNWISAASDIFTASSANAISSFTGGLSTSVLNQISSMWGGNTSSGDTGMWGGNTSSGDTGGVTRNSTATDTTSSAANRDLSDWTSANVTADLLNNAIVNSGHSNSAFLNKGQSIINAGNAAGIDPRALFAVMMHETGWGTSKMVKNQNNPGGLKGTDGKFMTFNTLDDGITAVANRFTNKNSKYYFAAGNKSFATIQPHYCPDNDGGKEWINGVTKIYGDLLDASGGAGGRGTSVISPRVPDRLQIGRGNDNLSNSSVMNASSVNLVKTAMQTKSSIGQSTNNVSRISTQTNSNSTSENNSSSINTAEIVNALSKIIELLGSIDKSNSDISKKEFTGGGNTVIAPSTTQNTIPQGTNNSKHNLLSAIVSGI